jgi:long-chain acyl-CoA synthetase
MTTMYSHLYEILLRRASAHPAAIALGSQEEHGWKTLDSLELLGTVDRLAADLAGRGVAEGDRVVAWLPGSWRTPVFMFAIWKLGAILVPFDRDMNPEGASKILDSVEPQLILTGYGEIPIWAPAGEAVEWWRPETARATGRSGDWRKPAEELATVVFTSGTTGVPKGCMITHANLCSQVETVGEYVPLDPGCRLASLLPLSHLFEMTGGLLYPLSTGASIHYIPSRKGPDILRVLQEQRITHMNAVPQLLGIMGKGLEDQMRAKLPGWAFKLASLMSDRLPYGMRRILFRSVHEKLGGHLVMMSSGGATLLPAVMRPWERIGIRLVEGYGASECAPVVSLGRPHSSAPIGSVGRPIRGVQVKLSPEGELLVKGPNVMRGYWRDPERTAEVLQDGWYHTGDLASIDEKGNIRLAGRAKDLIVLPSGMKVWPQDVEDVLRTDPAVKDAAVISAPGESGGARLHAHIIPAGTGVVDPQEIVGRCNPRLATHQRLSSASWWAEPDFPRTSILKVKRHLLSLPQAGAARVAAPADMLPAEDPVVQAILDTARVSWMSAQQTLGELGMDSLALVQLAVELEERIGRDVDDAALRLDMTAADVRDLVDSVPDRPPVAVAPSTTRREKARAPWPYTWGRVLRFLSFPIDLIYALSIEKTVVIGKEHLVGVREPVIFAGTHHSYADLPLVQHSLAGSPASRFARRLVVAAAADGFGAAGLYAKYAILAFGLYPLRRYGGGRESLDELAAIAEAGNAVLIFPQGTHARPEQEMAGDRRIDFKMGAAHLARVLKAKVVPFGVAGTEVAMPAHLEEFRGRVIAGIPVSVKRVPLAIAYGEPMAIGPEEDAQAFTVRLQAASYALTRQAEAALASGRGKTLVAG